MRTESIPRERPAIQKLTPRMRICAGASMWTERQNRRVPLAPAYPDFLLRSTRQDRVCGFL
jgi:hypothetical protein